MNTRIRFLVPRALRTSVLVPRSGNLLRHVADPPAVAADRRRAAGRSLIGGMKNRSVRVIPDIPHMLSSRLSWVPRRPKLPQPSSARAWHNPASRCAAAGKRHQNPDVLLIQCSAGAVQPSDTEPRRSAFLQVGGRSPGVSDHRGRGRADCQESGGGRSGLTVRS
jgi:hypothetical protein